MIMYKTALIIPTILIGIFFSMNLFALQPVESLVLGDFSADYNENKTDPLEYVFGRDFSNNGQSIDQFKKDLAMYRGFYEEGKNLNNTCKERRTIRYSNEWDKIQTKRMIMADMQYIGLDLSIRAIPLYAKFFEFTETEYNNLVDNIVGNFCSTNVSVISKKEIRNNLLIKFNKENNFKLPSVKGNPLFPDDMEKYVPERKRKENEFKATLKLFQSLCSWGGDPEDPGLMVPLIKHGALMSFVSRQLNAKSIDWNKEKNTLSLVDSDKTVQVACDNLICRKTTPELFKGKLILSLGATNFQEDFKSLFCDSFQIADYNLKTEDERLKKMMRNMTFDEENILVSQFIALITGVPDFLIGLEKYTDGDQVLRSSIDYTWNTWAKLQTNNLNRELYYEEPLTLELDDRRLTFNNDKEDLRLAFDVNLGEFDRINQRIGKLRTNFKIEIPASFIKHHRKEMSLLDWSNTTEKDRLLNRFKLHLEKDINFARERLIIPPWKGDLALLIAREVTDQILLKEDKLFGDQYSGMKYITVELNYSPFALKYLGHQFKIKEKEGK